MSRRVEGVLVVAAVLVAGCASQTSTDVVAEDDVVHVHDLLIREDDTVLAATHSGLYRVDDDGLDPIGDRRHDLMAAVLEGDAILASGHPDLRDDSLRVEDRPPLLGIVESTDGQTWSERSLLGEADFHRLVFAEDELFAANSSAGAVWVSADAGATWVARDGAAQLIALAVDPNDSSQMIGVDLDRGLVRSENGGDTWAETEGPALVDLAWTADGVIGHDDAGGVHRLDGAEWLTVEVIGDVAALGVRGDELFALRLPSTVLRSIDGGSTWKKLP
ncbi:MAG: hypothetical protein OSA99_16290 [Acidimicrobiales bacterium]|nr:hypothetical protein [Acidimicrobiales bacterium]